VPRIIALDAGPTGIASNDLNKPDVLAFHNWIARCLADVRTRIIIPEIADYEVRRKLLSLPHGDASIRRLDGLVRLGGPLVYVPINTGSMRRAAQLWSEARRGGYSTADEKALDGDVILAAQALEYVGHGDRLFIATGNESDLTRYVGERAQPWEAITP
jgi:predicted nucleic acid-binding protein